MSPLKLWRASIALQRRGHGRLAAVLQHLNTLLYGNSLSPRATVGPGLWLGHHAFGTVVQDNVTIGSKVTIWHNVTLEAAGEDSTWLTIEDGANVGASAVIAAPPGRRLRVGRGARVGAGAVVTEDVPDGATVVAARTRLVQDGESAPGGERAGLDEGGEPA
jgi:serine O-acetyltransferase